MALPISPPYPPMEALVVEKIPAGEEWHYEPKWDGFRCLVFKDGSTIELQSKNGRPLGRYFPELVAAVEAVNARQFIIDGEVVILAGGKFSFDALLQRIHPAESRIRKLSREHPARLIVFDLLAGADGKSLVGLRLKERRRRLEAFYKDHLENHESFKLSPATTSVEHAQGWLRMAGATLDGVVAKRLDLPYQSGERSGMQKVKYLRTADCVVGGFRYASTKGAIGSLLLGLYDEQGLLHHVGYTSGFSRQERRRLLEKLEPLIKPPGFTGNAPGGPSRWSSERSMEWQPLKPDLVVEVQYDHFSGNRFRHATRLLRWRPDKSPKDCSMSQVESGGRTIETDISPQSS